MRKLLQGLKSDESLMLAYQKGDSSAFEVLYMRHKEGLFAFLYRSCQQSAVVEELAHDAWTSIIRSIETYQPKARFKTYLYSVAHNKLVDHWRRDSRRSGHVDFDELEIAADESSPEEISARGQIQKSLSDAIMQLPVEQRDAFLLREAGFSQEQIGEIVGAGKETVKSRLRYAGNQLRSSLVDNLPESGDEMSTPLLTGVKQ